jgi:hypothetical protein
MQTGFSLQPDDDTHISKKKPIFPVNEKLRRFLHRYGREVKLPLQYNDLLRWENSFHLYDKKGKDTLWESVLYSQNDREHLNQSLTYIYVLLKAGGEQSVADHLHVDRIDYCTFGNSNPFRIRIVNNYNDNFDYFYIKQADSSRIYGLELEHILSPNRISYFVHGATLIEEHIAGIPGDQFIKSSWGNTDFNVVRMAKEFVKFNERCFVRLLGDMRAYNFVIDITPDFEEVHYRIRAIDFDQQSYEGKMNVYMPQFFKENRPFVDLCFKYLNNETVQQYQIEERVLIAKRIKAARWMLFDLMNCLSNDAVSIPEKVKTLREELSEYYESDRFLKCRNMGEIVKTSLKEMLMRNKQHYQKLS